MNKPCFCRNLFLTDWRYKRLKNTADLLFYGEHFYGFSESEVEKRISMDWLNWLMSQYRKTNVAEFFLKAHSPVVEMGIPEKWDPGP